MCSVCRPATDRNWNWCVLYVDRQQKELATCIRHAYLHTVCSTLTHTSARCSTLTHTSARSSTLTHTSARCSTLTHTSARLLSWRFYWSRFGWCLFVCLFEADRILVLLSINKQICTPCLVISCLCLFRQFKYSCRRQSNHRSVAVFLHFT